MRWFTQLHNSADNVLVAVADEEEEDQPSCPKGRPEPKARPTSSSRSDLAAGAARPMAEGRASPAESGVVAASREAIRPNPLLLTQLPSKQLQRSLPQQLLSRPRRQL